MLYTHHHHHHQTNQYFASQLRLTSLVGTFRTQIFALFRTHDDAAHEAIVPPAKCRKATKITRKMSENRFIKSNLSAVQLHDPTAGSFSAGIVPSAHSANKETLEFNTHEACWDETEH